MKKKSKKLLEQVVQSYLGSSGFNGLGVHILKDRIETCQITELISERKLDLIRGDGHPNPHIKAFDAEPVEIQLKKIKNDGLVGCLYPTPELLAKLNIGKDEVAPYTKELMLGAPQLVHRAFDLRMLEWYRNDPRFDYETDDIHGRITQLEDTRIEKSKIVRDGLEFLEFGFAYNEELHRAVVAFVCYLHDLPPAQQIEMKKHELAGVYNLHPDFHRTRIIGDFPERPSIYDAFLEEKQHINDICKLMGKPWLFHSSFNNHQRPRSFGILIRPTKKEFRDFALQLDKLLSDDLNRNFFKGDVELTRKLTDEKGEEVVQSKGTITLLEEWIGLKFRPVDPEPLKEMLSNFRAVRKMRQKPAHKVEDDEFDQKYVEDQRKLIRKAFNAVRLLRMALENHPTAKNYEIPDYLRNALVWEL